MERLVSVIMDNTGILLPYTTQSTHEQVIEWADTFLAGGWKAHEKIGAKIVYCKLITIEDV